MKDPAEDMLSIPDLIEFHRSSESFSQDGDDDESSQQPRLEDARKCFRPRVSDGPLATAVWAASVDELQALNTALCFLCSINADSRQIFDFCTWNPASLLMEGVAAGSTSGADESSAKSIVQQQMQRCGCFSPMCNQNRHQIMSILNQGFEYYRGLLQQRQSHKDQQPSVSSLLSAYEGPEWRMHLHELTTLEREIRELRAEELAMRNRLLEAAVELRGYQDELQLVNKCLDHLRPGRRSVQAKASLSNLMTSCMRNHSEILELLEQQDALEYEMEVAALNLKSVEREHQDVLRQIRQGRKVQFAVLKGAFVGCRRHVCVSSSSPSTALKLPLSGIP